MKIRQGEKQMNLNSARISDFEINNWPLKQRRSLTKNEKEKDEGLTAQSKNVGDLKNPQASSLISG